MPVEEQRGLSDKERESLLGILESEGKSKWQERWKEHMAITENLNVLSQDEKERDKILRYLLLRVLINQQAKFEKVKNFRQLKIGFEKNFAYIKLE